MKKTLLKIFVSVLAVCTGLMCFVGCGGDFNPDSITLTTLTKEVEVGGFIAETENYVYYINGVGDSNGDNKYGVPVKGSLMAADKADLTKTCVVVPKLFVATDYKAGVYVYDGYVYYGTTNTDLNSSGNVAKDELVFAKSKLDGTETEILFNAGALSTEYRIVKAADKTVYIIYYSSADKAIISYNASTKEKITVAKTDDEAAESLDAYKFVDNEGAVNGAVVMFSSTVYSEEFNQAKKDSLGDKYSRATESYNKVYAYKPGDVSDTGFAGAVVADGNKNIPTKFSFVSVKGKYVFIKETDGTDKAITVTYAVNALDLAKTKILNASYVEDGTLINDLNAAYKVVDGYLVKLSLVDSIEGENGAYNTVMKADSVSKLLFTEGDYVYYVNSSTFLARKNMMNFENENAFEQVISEGKIADSWYAPEIRNGNVYYCDASEYGNSYIKYASVSDALDIERDDDTDEIVSVKFAVHTLIGKVTDADTASFAETEINDYLKELKDNKIVFDTDDEGKYVLKDGKPVCTPLDKANEVYENLGDLKDLVSETTETSLKNYNKAKELSVELFALKDFDKLSETEKTALKDTFEKVYAKTEALKKDKDYSYNTVTGMVETNAMYYLNLANKFFNTDKK